VQRSQKRDEQTNRQKTQRFGCHGCGWNPSPIKLGMVTEENEHYGPLKIWQKPDTINLKPHNSVTPW